MSTESPDLEDIKSRAEKFIAAHDEMCRIGYGIGGLGTDRPDLMPDFDAWYHASDVEHADTVLAIIESLKPRTVTTVEELRALKLPAIIDSPAGGPARVDYYAGPVRQQRYVESLFADDESGDECYSPEYFATFGLPATVLHEGSRA